MIGLPVASMIGGMITPAGGAVNVIAISYISDLAGNNVDFLTWMAIFAPIAIVAFPIAFEIIYRVYKPVPISQEEIHNYLEKLEIPEKPQAAEIRTAIVIAAMIICWVLGTWVKVFNIMIVAMVGVGILMLPKFGVFTWKDFAKEANWTSFIMVGTLVGLTGLLRTNGVVKWFNAILDLSWLNISPYLMVFVISVIGFLLLIIMPVGPTLVTAFSAALAAVGAAVGVDPTMLICAFVMCATCCFLFPIDVVPLLTYSTGYYEMTDMPKSTALIQLVLCVLAALWMPTIIGWIF